MNASLWAFGLCLAGSINIACSSSSTVDDDGGGGTSSGGSAGAAAGQGGQSGSAGSSAQGGAAGQAGNPGEAGASGSTGGSAGAAGSGPCVPTNVTIDFTNQGTVRRDRFTQSGVTIVGSADLQFSDASSNAYSAGLGVYGGYYDWTVDLGEYVTFSFAAPATNIHYTLEAYNLDAKPGFATSTLTAYDAEGAVLGDRPMSDVGPKNVSGLYLDVPISKFLLTVEDGLSLTTLSFTSCL